MLKKKKKREKKRGGRSERRCRGKPPKRFEEKPTSVTNRACQPTPESVSPTSEPSVKQVEL
jgi:hypothetical protein